MPFARRQFVKTLLIGTAATMTATKLKALDKLTNGMSSDRLMPILFIGHGNPMNALEDNFYTNEWKRISKDLPVPKAILCVSAHWLTKGSYVSMAEAPKTIHDFYGFPEEMYEIKYAAPGAPEMAEITRQNATTRILPDHEWGLDHGTWSVLRPMFPRADIPTYQLSIDYQQPPSYHYELAGQLRHLRSKGVLIIGSGNIVHNLKMMRMEDKAYDWAIEFDETIKTLIDQRDHQQLLKYDSLGSMARMAVPTPDHFYPLLYSLGASNKDEKLEYFAAHTTMGAISMRSVKIG